MRAEDTLQFMMDFYGDVFPTRKHCLNALFCEIGNGYIWENGEIIINSEFLDRWQLKEPIKHASPSEVVTTVYLTTERLRKINRPDSDDKFVWYPISEYSKIMKIPDDIKDDWLEILKECITYMIEDNITVDREICDRINNIEEKRFNKFQEE